jgi:hypothetical protein
MKKLFSVVLLLLVMLAGCRSDTVDTPLYDGKNLVIGVIGNSPKVREVNVKFKNINFNKLEEGKNLSSEFDAIFIMKEHLSEAANSKYAAVYKNSGIPFFFIESTKSYIPFVNEQISYDNSPNIDAQTYATGYFQSGEGKYQYWGYGLYNDMVNGNNIKGVYTRLFTTIESVK